MLIPILALGVLAALFGLLLGFSSIKFKVEGNPVAEKVSAALPGSNCGQCGFAGCNAYAEAVAEGECDINLCPPGGEDSMRAIAEIMEVEPVEMAADDADQGADANTIHVARINEKQCIGCNLCHKACPVDAIIGCPGQLHVVMIDECISCKACVKPCPMECISMTPIKIPNAPEWPLPRNHEGATV
ncbi:MAG: electron transport complex subunit RsxB [Gammaproteobacteria bacterium]|nr:MAG: electron transport complex subunit RsxB [Gammaproteobacteria bacterium]